MKKILVFVIAIVLSVASGASFAEKSTGSDLNSLDDETLVQMAGEISVILQERNKEHGILISAGTYIAGFDFPAGGYDIVVPEDAKDNSVGVNAYTAGRSKMMAETGAYADPDLVSAKCARKGEPYHIYLKKGDKLEIDGNAILVLSDPLFGVKQSSADDILVTGWEDASFESLQAALLSVNNEIQNRLNLGTGSETSTQTTGNVASDESVITSTPAPENNSEEDVNIPELTSSVDWEDYLTVSIPEGAEDYINEYSTLLITLHGKYGSALDIMKLDDDGYADEYICEHIVSEIAGGFIDTSATEISQSDPFKKSGVSYAGVGNCYYYETNIDYKMVRLNQTLKVVVILAKREGSVYAIALISKDEADEKTLLSMVDSIQWK